MESLGITYENVSWNNDKFRILVARLLALAKIETGFDIDNYKLSIETIPQNKGCVIIFTLSKKPISKQSETRKKFRIVNKSQPYIYKFNRLEDMLSACQKLHRLKRGKIKNSSILSLKNEYFLIVYSVEPLAKSASVLLSEYGENVKSNNASIAYLYESGKIIHNKNAINYIGKYMK